MIRTCATAALTALLAVPVALAGGDKAEKSPDKAALLAKVGQMFGAGQFEESIPVIEKALKLDPEDGMANHRMGYALHMLGRIDEAYPYHLACAKSGSSQASVGAYNVACVHALKGEPDQAFDWLGKWVEMDGGNRAQMDGDTDLDSLRDDPRYAKLRDGVKAARLSPYVASTARGSARLAYFGQGTPGQLSIDYGKVAWKDSYDQDLAAGKLDGKRWRLGQDFWTTLDTSMHVRIGDAELAPGQYYLVAQKHADQFKLLALDPAEVRRYKIDASAAAKTKGGTEIVTKHKVIDEVADTLAFDFEMKKELGDRGYLVVSYGPHRLYSPVEVITAADG